MEYTEAARLGVTSRATEEYMEEHTLGEADLTTLKEGVHNTGECREDPKLEEGALIVPCGWGG